MTGKFFPVVAVMAIAISWAVSAGAQSASSRVYNGVFGGSGASKPVEQRFDVSFDLGEAYDDNVLADLGGPVQGAQSGGYYTLFDSSASYRFQREHLQVGVSGSSAIRYYNDLREVRSVSHSVGAGLTATLTSRTTMKLNSTAAYSPSYLYGLFPSDDVSVPGESIDAAPDYAVSASESYAYGATLGLRHAFGRRTSMSLASEFAYTDYLHEDDRQRDFSSYGARVEYERGVSRENALKVAYHFRRGEFGYAIGGTAQEHGLDLGMHLARPFSATRKVAFDFRIGSSVLDAPESDFAGVPAGRQYRATVDASVGYDLGRTWQARGTYRRGFEYLAAFRDPVFTDGFSAGLDGLLNRRWEFRASAGYSTGASAIDRGRSAFDTYTGTVRLQYALGRKWAVYSEYLYYFYDFGASTALRPGLPPTLERNSVRVGLTAWIPLIGR